MTRPVSLSGAGLDGECPVRFVYADESGLSEQEPILVVAGVIIHADLQWLPAEQRIRAIMDEYVPRAERPRGFVFRAADLFQGSGKVFKNREKYPRERRIQALKEILSIPSQLELPVVFGWTRKEREDLPDQSKKSVRAERAFEHAHALALCAIGAETYMRGWALPIELATLTVEDNTETKRTVSLMHDAFRDVAHPAISNWAKSYAVNTDSTDFFPLTKVVDGVHFVGKSGAFLLQLADACAWIIRRYLEEKPGIEELLEAFVPRGAHAIYDLEKARECFAGQGNVRCWTNLHGL